MTSPARHRMISLAVLVAATALLQAASTVCFYVSGAAPLTDVDSSITPDTSAGGQPRPAATGG